MIDYFALLQQPRRPWLDLEELKKTYQQITLASHPDRKATKSGDSNADVAAINEAYRVLTNPKLRLQHLLELKGRTPIADESTLGGLMELFSQTGTLVQEIDCLLEKMKGTINPLTRSLLRSDILDKQTRCNDVLNKLKDVYEDALRELRELSDAWDDQPRKVTVRVEQLYHRVSYLMRWMDQLEERRFQLSTL